MVIKGEHLVWRNKIDELRFIETAARQCNVWALEPTIYDKPLNNRSGFHWPGRSGRIKESPGNVGILLVAVGKITYTVWVKKFYPLRFLKFFPNGSEFYSIISKFDKVMLYYRAQLPPCSEFSQNELLLFDDKLRVKTQFINFWNSKQWLSGIGRRTCDLVVAGSRPGRDAAA